MEVKLTNEHIKNRDTNTKSTFKKVKVPQKEINLQMKNHKKKIHMQKHSSFKYYNYFG
jgi:hypothetical protein